MVGADKKYLTKAGVVFCLVVLCVCMAGWSAEAAGSDAETSPAQQKLRAKITYSCLNKPIEEVLDELAEQARLCIVRSPQVTGPVTLKVYDVPLEEVLSNILAANDFTYVATRSMIRVVPLSEAATLREEVVTEVYRITYGDVSEVAEALKNFVSQFGRIAVNTGTSHLVVTDTADRIKAVSKFIEQIDRETEQVLVEVRIYDIISNDAFDIETKWNVERNADTITEKNTRTNSWIDSSGNTTNNSTNLYKLLQDRQDYSSGEDVTIDNARDAFGVNGTGLPLGYVGDNDNYGSNDFSNLVKPVYAESGSDSKQITGWTENSGTRSSESGDISDWSSIARDNSGRTVKEWQRKRRKPVFGGSFDRKNGGTISISLLNNAIDLDFVLSMLHSLEEAKLLANPRVMVLDNETALFETVREIPYTERTTTAGSAGTITSTKFKSVGVKLNVTPHIARDGMIRLKIEPEFGVVVDLNRDGAPTIDTRRAVTTNIVRDGQTIVLGGLRKSEMRKEVDKVPLLGDIPVLGMLFRGESESEMTTELVVFITTSIVESPTLTGTEQMHLDTTNRMISEISRPKPKSKSWLRPEKSDGNVTHEYIDKWMEAKKKKAGGE